MKKIVYLLLIGMLVLKIFESTDTVRAQEQLAPPSEEEWDLAWRSDGSYLWISENLRQDTTEGFFKLDTFVDVGDKFYYVDDEKNTVNTINYDGSDRQTIVDAEGEYIEGIIVTEQYLYVKFGNRVDWIAQYNLNGQDGCRFLLGDTLSNICFYNGLLYIYIEYAYSTFCGKVDGNSELTDTEWGWVDIYDICEESIYFREYQDNTLYRMNMDGTDQEILNRDGIPGSWIGMRDNKIYYSYENGKRLDSVSFRCFDCLNGETSELELADFKEMGGVMFDNQLLYQSGEGLWTYNMDTGENNLLVEDDGTLYELCDIPEATRPYYMRKQDDIRYLYTVDIETGQEQLLYELIDKELRAICYAGEEDL